MCYSLADIVEVGCLTTDDAAEDDDGVEAVILAHLLCAIDELETSRNGLDMDVLRYRAVLLQCPHRAVEERASNIMVPFSDDDAEAHIAGIGYAVEIVV